MLSVASLQERAAELTITQGKLIARSLQAIHGCRYLPHAKRTALAIRAFELMSGAPTPHHIQTLLAELIALDFKVA